LHKASLYVRGIAPIFVRNETIGRKDSNPGPVEV
jgi:hypothetical protein